MPVLRKLPSRLKSCVYELSGLRSALCSLEEQLARTLDGVMASDAAPKKAFAPIAQHFDAAIAHMRSLVNARGEEAQAQAQAFFAKVGLAEGAVITLTYPVYGRRLAMAFDEERLPRRLEQATLRIEGFTVEHVRSRTEVVLGVSARVLHDGKLAKDGATFCLHPGCSFDIVQPAPAKAALPAPSATPSPVPVDDAA
jgi:hypothetical protein